MKTTEVQRTLSPDIVDSMTTWLREQPREELVQMVMRQAQQLARLIDSHTDMTTFMETMGEKYTQAGAAYAQNIQSIRNDMNGVTPTKQ